MKKINRLKLIIFSKYFIFFLFLLIIPIFVLSIVKYLLDKSGIFIHDNLFFATLNYFTFLIFFISIYIFAKKEVNYFSNENWFYTLGNAFIPSIIAFGLGFLVTFGFIFIIEILPVSQNIKEWITIPNQGYIEIFEQIKNKNHFFIILWIFYIVFLAPLTEEILFRGALQKFVGRVIKFKNFDCIITALIFSMFHINSLSNAVFSFIVGYILSRERKITGKINTSIWIHSIINFIGLFYGIIFEYKR